jgi:hypothetical protein
MSYDIYLTDPDSGKALVLNSPHDLRGGTFALGGTNEAWLNVTYNYGSHFRRVMGDNGIRTIYDMTGADSIPVLDAAIEILGDDVDEDYWKPTEGNAKESLKRLRLLAQAAPHGIWSGD